jgi:putative membrane protein
MILLQQLLPLLFVIVHGQTGQAFQSSSNILFCRQHRQRQKNISFLPTFTVSLSTINGNTELTVLPDDAVTASSTTATAMGIEPLPDLTLQWLHEFSNDVDSLSNLRPPTTDADISAPVTLISAGSSYTRLWTSSTWKSHSRPPHLRYARHVLLWNTSTTARQIFPSVVISVLWAMTLSLLSQRSLWMQQLLRQVSPASTAVSILTAPLALLLTLRANSSLSRINEARLLWGRLVLHVRTLSGLLRVYLLPHAPRTTIAAARLLTLVGWSVKAYVRGESNASEQDTYRTMVDSATAEWLVPSDSETNKNRPSRPPSRTALTARIRLLCATAIREAERNATTTTNGYPIHSSWTTPHLLIEEQIANLEQVIGGCERLFGSPIPPTYSRHLSRVMSIFLFLMPVGLV